MELTFEETLKEMREKPQRHLGGTQSSQKGQQVHSPGGDVFALFEGQQGGQAV